MQLDPDEIRSYQQTKYFENNKSSPDPFAIFIAVLAAILVAWFIRVAYVEWQIRQVVNIFNQEMVLLNQQSQKSIERMQIDARLRQQAALEHERLKVEIKQQEELSNRAAIQAEIDLAKSKEQAWKRFYKPISGCESSNNDKDFIKCGNDHAKAIKRFESQWSMNH